MCIEAIIQLFCVLSYDKYFKRFRAKVVVSISFVVDFDRMHRSTQARKGTAGCEGEYENEYDCGYALRVRHDHNDNDHKILRGLLLLLLLLLFTNY